MEDRQLIIMGLVLIGIAVLWYVANKPVETTEYDAKNFVLNDAQTKYPGADTAVILSNYSGGSWKMKVRATLNQNSSCPTRIHIYYDYPALQFATKPDEYITKDCRICINAPECKIVFPEEALIASHTLPGTYGVKAFLQQNPGAIGDASLVSSYGDYTNVWEVRWGVWDGPEVQGIYVLMDTDGTVLETGDWGSDS